MGLELRGKTAIVTGGSRGIGKAVARELAAEGVRVAVVARSRGDLESANELAAETGGRVIAIPCDTGLDDSVRAMVETAVAELSGVDILVNCAAQPGGQSPHPNWRTSATTSSGPTSTSRSWATSDAFAKSLGICSSEVAVAS